MGVLPDTTRREGFEQSPPERGNPSNGCTARHHPPGGVIELSPPERGNPSNGGTARHHPPGGVIELSPPERGNPSNGGCAYYVSDLSRRIGK